MNAVTGEMLLAEQVDFEVDPGTVQHLTTPQLCIAALRQDLDQLVRSRAYGLFLMRQLTAKEGSTRPGDERELPLFLAAASWN